MLANQEKPLLTLDAEHKLCRAKIAVGHPQIVGVDTGQQLDQQGPFLSVGGDGGLASAAVLMSLCASAKRHKLNPWAYLTDVMTQLAAKPAAKPADVTDLLPDAWAKHHLPANT